MVRAGKTAVKNRLGALGMSSSRRRVRFPHQHRFSEDRRSRAPQEGDGGRQRGAPRRHADSRVEV